jgi:hypothetical protein
VSERREFPKFEGGGRALALGGAAALIGLGGTVVRALVGTDGPRVALFAYLTSFAYWLGLSLAALLLLMIFHASHAKWPVVVRRPLEAMAASVIVFPILFVPIAIWLPQLYEWAMPREGFSVEVQHLFAHRRVYLNVPFFLGRAAFYFLSWIVVSWSLFRWSRKQDSTGDVELTLKSWRLGAGALPLVGLTLTFAAFDWLMTLSTEWQSSVWGVYYFAGSMVALFGLHIIVVLLLGRTPAMAGALRPAHWLSLGKFLLAFVCFWAYIAYSQYMLTWIANLPDAEPYLLHRQTGGWQYIFYALIIGHFVVPFLILLSRWIKLHPTALATMGLWILFIHFVDLYAVVMPQVHPHQPLFDWANVASFVGVGGVAVVVAVLLMRGGPAVPVRDPYLADSLAYEKMM